MEFIIVPQLILVFSLAGVLFILGRNFSKFRNVYEEGERDKSLGEAMARVKKEEEKFMYLCRRLAKRINLKTAREKHKQFSGAARIKLEKILRKTRIGFLKLDNKFIVLIERLRKRKENDKPVPKNPPNPLLQRGKFQEGNGSLPEIPLTPFDKGGNSKREISKEGNIKNKKISKEKEYLEMISDDPKNTDAYWKLGILYSRRRNYRDALNCFKEIAKIKPGYEKAKKKVKDISEKLRK